MQLSKNFTLQEFTKSQTALRLGIDNTPESVHVERLTLLCEHILQPVRDKFGPVSVSSGYRCQALNRAKDSKDTSDHVQGFAADFEVPGVSNLDVAKWIHWNLKFKQLILEFYTPGDENSGWIHCSYDKDALKQHVMTATMHAGKQVYLPGLVA